MHRYLVLLIAVSLLLASCQYVRLWFTHFRSQPSVADRKHKNKSRPCPFPTMRPECPLCQAEETIAFLVTPSTTKEVN